MIQISKNDLLEVFNNSKQDSHAGKYFGLSE
jgi:hypothetical protein